MMIFREDYKLIKQEAGSIYFLILNLELCSEARFWLAGGGEAPGN
jgi:hypothetical protein